MQKGGNVASKAPRNIQERTFEFGLRIVRLVDRLPRTLSATEIGRQMLRSGTSVGANMEEAKGAESRRDFIHKTSTAYKEARETFYWLSLIDAAVLCRDQEVLSLRQECDEVIRILHTILRKARSSQQAA
ncbi:MAG TPA: four helix bundle protein [Anaerolineae bacterium]|nr:four helix bundle protein [Anaerolineae bacterium]